MYSTIFVSAGLPPDLHFLERGRRVSKSQTYFYHGGFGNKGGENKGGHPKGGGARNFAFFFPLSLSRHKFLSFFPLLGVFSWNFGGALKRRALKCARFGVLGLLCEAPAAQQGLHARSSSAPFRSRGRQLVPELFQTTSAKKADLLVGVPRVLLDTDPRSVVVREVDASHGRIFHRSQTAGVADPSNDEGMTRKASSQSQVLWTRRETRQTNPTSRRASPGTSP